ncbi:hypothetical protein ABID22_003325 [Pontibacter aydingkolensis]|uniref:DUF4064 domain-containing protein n=1 Tax=Pontibacter aydingkolensis TaxID=1911536 RepID=A0ABS7CU75_9BACT|nr:hypothetical protein [Pontibacter aydingkolensis]MBW7467406.1 hypothetical protein [Pontibacter aydingkolensis]
MKAGIFSVLIGITGLIVITYFIYQANVAYQQPEELATLYTLSTTTIAIFFILEAAGVALGILSYKRGNKKIGLFGMSLCSLNLILLYAQF